MPLCISLLLQTLHSVVCTQCYVCLSVCLSVNVHVFWSVRVSLRVCVCLPSVGVSVGICLSVYEAVWPMASSPGCSRRWLLA